MPKPQDIFQLAQQEAVRVTASPQAWQSFLYTAAHNYHTTYLNQLLIHAQRPDAAACASMEYWNTKANRLVMRGSRSITVLQRRQGMAVTKPVFAIGDTTLLSQTRTGGPWEVTDTTRPLLLQDKSDDWLTALAQDGVSNDADRARRMLERNVADSTLQWAQPDEQMQLLQALAALSAVDPQLLGKLISPALLQRICKGQVGHRLELVSPKSHHALPEVFFTWILPQRNHSSVVSLPLCPGTDIRRFSFLREVHAFLIRQIRGSQRDRTTARQPLWR